MFGNPRNVGLSLRFAILYNFFVKKQGYFPFLVSKTRAKICKIQKKE